MTAKVCLLAASVAIVAGLWRAVGLTGVLLVAGACGFIVSALLVDWGGSGSAD